jgi:hypothetical protein
MHLQAITERLRTIEAKQREAILVCLSPDLDGQRACTYQEVADVLDVSRQAVWERYAWRADQQ